MPRIETVNRVDLRDVLDRYFAANPTKPVGALGARRNALHQRYTPTTATGRGALAYVGDCSDVATRERVRTSRTKIELEAAGTLRLQTVKRKIGVAPMKHWASKDGKCAVSARNARERGLYGPLVGFYNDPQALARGGEWRPWCFLDLRTLHEVHLTLDDERVIMRILDLE